MKVGSKVVPTIDYNLVFNKTLVFKPFTPNPDTICTVANINDKYITLQECQVKSIKGEKVDFDRAFWRELNDFLISKNVTHGAIKICEVCE